MSKVATNWLPVLACLAGAYLSGLVALGRISSRYVWVALDVANLVVLMWFLYRKDHRPRKPSLFLIEHRRAFKVGLYVLVALTFFVTVALRVLVKQPMNSQRIIGFVFTIAFITSAVYYINQATRPSIPRP